MASNDTVLYEKKGRISYITINRPERMNAVDRSVREGLATSFMSFRDDDNAWVAIVTGAGDRAFCAGADLRDPADSGSVDHTGSRFPPPSINDGTLQVWKPIIAAINGYALGAGLELALSMDIRIAAEHAELGLTEAKRGRGARGGGTVKLLRFIPIGVALEYMFTGRHMSAQRAYELGLVNKVVPKGQLMQAAEDLANEIMECAPLSVRWMKENALKGLSLSMYEAMRLRVGPDIFHMEDFLEGSRAFAEKRKPNWKGR